MADASSRLAAIRDRIARAAGAAGRKAGDVTLIAVTKTRSAAEIEALIAAGQRDFGESRVQEATDKWPALLHRHPDIRLHMIGRLQSNKAAEAADLFHAIHSVDRPSLRDALAAATGCPDLFVQVNIGDEDQKGGCAIPDLTGFVDSVRAAALPLTGLMAIPPRGRRASPYFALLAKLAGQVGLEGLSMGMSDDFESAVMIGATHVRVGTALFEDA